MSEKNLYVRASENNRHWTNQFAVENYLEGKGRFTVITRSGGVDGLERGRYRCTDDITKYYEKLFEIPNYRYSDEENNEKVRFALHPENGGRFAIMNYQKDGSFWVKGWILDGKWYDENKHSR